MLPVDCLPLCGITEPFEFAFMFTAPGLYVIYALLYGIFTYVTALTGFRAGFSFSAGENKADSAVMAEKAEIVEGVDVTSLLKGLGGRENILSADNCATRLRMELKDPGLMNEQILKRAGAKGVIKLGKNSVQVIIGLKVQGVADAVRNHLK